MPERQGCRWNVSDGLGVGLRPVHLANGVLEGQVDDAVAVEGPGAQDGGVVHVAAQHLGAKVGDRLGGGVRAGQPEDLVPGTDEFGARAEPIQPEAPVTKMRMKVLLGCAAWLCRRNADAIQSHRPEHTDATKSHRFLE